MGYLSLSAIFYLTVQAVVATDDNSTFGLDLDAWWGSDDKRNDTDTSIRPFEISFDQEMIDDLQYRLKNNRKPAPPMEDTKFEYGFNTAVLESWLTSWAENYTFKEREQYLNKYPQYLVNIQGVDIHYIEYSEEVPNDTFCFTEASEDIEVVPLLLIHGWPGSVREFYETIPYLTAISEKRNFALKVIVPSLPGFGYSGAAVKAGLGGNEIAVLFKLFMERLGYDKFYTQGGDWGGIIGSALCTIFPDSVLGFHTNLALAYNQEALTLMLLGSQYPSYVVDTAQADRIYPLTDHLFSLISGFGYFHLQSTKPDSLGVAMSDSPGGILAYILHLVSSGTRKYFSDLEDGGLEQFYTRDQLLDNLMMYWAPNSITTSFRIYAETFNKKAIAKNVERATTSVPTCTIHAKYEIAYQSPKMLKTRFTNLLNSTHLETGGHFLAFELPELFAESVLDAITLFRDWHAQNDATEDST